MQVGTISRLRKLTTKSYLLHISYVLIHEQQELSSKIYLWDSCN